jgi:protein O-mannosyl-transferase
MPRARDRAKAGKKSTRERTSSPAAGLASSRVVWWLALALVGAGVLAYASTLSAPFVMDDGDSIVRNPFISSLWPLSQAMRAPVQSAFAGRPIVSLSLAISYLFDGVSPAPFRVWNLGVLIASALVLFGILRRTMRRAGRDTSSSPELLAAAAAMIWLLHPLQTEVVGYVSQRTESMMGLCYLITLYATARAIEKEPLSKGWALVAIAACAIGMACKESMVTAPVMVLLYDVVFGAHSVQQALRRRAAFYAGLAATWLLLLVLNADAPRSGSAGFSTAISASTYLLNQAVMIVTYLKLSIWPHPLVLDYGRTHPIAFMTALPYLIAVIALLSAVAVAWIRHRVLAYLGTWFFVTLAPSSSLIPIATEVGAERRMYLPLAAIVTLVVLAVAAATRRLAGSARYQATTTAAVFLGASIALGAVTITRNREYMDPIGIWQTVLDRRPQGRAHYNLAIALKDAGRRDEAVAHYRQALPDEPAAHYALGFEAAQVGRFDESASEMREFLRLRQADATAPKASVLLGDALVQLGKPAEAEQAFREALRMVPGYTDARGALADLFLAERRYPEAIAAYQQYLAMMPTSVNGHHSLGLALVATGQEAAAIPEFEKAVSLKPSDAMLRLSLGNALAAVAKLDLAVAQYREGLRIAPTSVGMMSALALTLATNGERDEALAWFRRAMQLEPDNPDVQSDYAAARALWQARR